MTKRAQIFDLCLMLAFAVMCCGFKGWGQGGRRYVTTTTVATTTTTTQPWPQYAQWVSDVQTASNVPKIVTVSDFTGANKGWMAYDNAIVTRWQSAASSYPHWLYFDLGNGSNQTVVSAVFQFYHGYNMAGFSLAGSTDDSTYTTNLYGVCSNNSDFMYMFTNAVPASCRYYKMVATNGTDDRYLSMTESYFTSARHFPVMTTTNAPSPLVASADSITATAPAYFAFDYNHNASNAWASGAGAYPHWLKLDAGASCNVAGFLVWSKVGHGPKGNVTFSGSANDSDWTEIFVTNITDVATRQIFTNSNSSAYRYYKLDITNGYSGVNTIVHIVEWRLLRYD